MDTSAAGAARELGTNVPRVLRAADRLRLIPGRTSKETLRLSSGDLARLRAALGVAAVIPGLRRSQVQVLAALARAPLGLRSQRALGRAAGLSPTAAGRALRDLIDDGLVELRRETLAEGKAREVEVIHANVLDPRWAAIAPQLARIRPPARSRPTSRRVPSAVAHAFWNAPVAAIDVVEHGAYIARRALLDGDTQVLAWAAQVLSPADWGAAARTRGLDPPRRALAENLAASPA